MSDPPGWHEATRALRAAAAELAASRDGLGAAARSRDRSRFATEFARWEIARDRFAEAAGIMDGLLQANVPAERVDARDVDAARRAAGAQLRLTQAAVLFAGIIVAVCVIRILGRVAG